jgi:spore maturation protein CgeB
MRFALFVGSLVDDRGQPGAHALRGICGELLERGHLVDVYEEEAGSDTGHLSRRRFAADYPRLHGLVHARGWTPVEAVLAEADAVLVHASAPPDLARSIGRHRARHGGYALLFHTGAEASAGEPEAIARWDLGDYDGVLAPGEAVARLWRATGTIAAAWSWHEAADTTRFRPLEAPGDQRGVVWIGDWSGDRDLEEFLIEPLRRLRLRAALHGGGWPDEVLAGLRASGIEHLGWLPNAAVPQAYAAARCAIHVPRRANTRALPGVPSIRMFEAMACGVPLVIAPWHDSERLFRPGQDYLVAHDGAEMERHLKDLIGDPLYAKAVAASGLERIRARHTCAHRVDELLAILADLGADEDAEEAVVLDETEEAG